MPEPLEKPFDLAALLSPLSVDAFFEQYWEQAPLHLRREPGRYASVVTEADLERVIRSSDLRFPALQLVREGSYFPADVYTSTVRHGTEVWTGVPDLEKVNTEYRSGTTIVLPALHRSFAPLREFAATLESFLDHAIHANAYLTPGGAAGFNPHYDTHEVFVLQVAGRKHWRVYPPPVKLPHRTQPFNPTGYVLPSPILELELQPGDLLYLPRGYVHSALTSDSHSAHVTMGVTVYTWLELLTEVLASAKASEPLRRALPPGFASRAVDFGALDRGLREHLETLRDGVSSLRVSESFVHKARTARPRARAKFRAAVNVITLETSLRVAIDGAARLTTEAGFVALHFAGKTLNLPLGLRPTLEAMCSRGNFRLAELPADIEAPARLAFARYLEEEGFLTQSA